MNVGAAVLRRFGDANHDVVGKAQRGEDTLTDNVAVILAGHCLHHHRHHRVGAAAVVGHTRTWRPIQREVAHLRAHLLMIQPGIPFQVSVGKAALMGDDLVQRDVGFATGGEFRQVVGHLIHEGHLAFLHQCPEPGHAQHLGLRKQQPQRVVGSLPGFGASAGVTIGAEQGELAVPSKRDLCAGIAALVEMGPDQCIEMLNRLRCEAKAFQIGGGKRVGHVSLRMLWRKR